MAGTGLLFVVLLIAVLPIIPAWLYFRAGGMGGISFLLSLGAGFLSVPIVLAVQNFLPPSLIPNGTLFIYVLVRIALVEELSRLVTLFPLLRFSSRWGNTFENPESRGAAAGLAAGIGFAAAESAFYAASDPLIILLRAFTAAPLHGACGARAGTALGLIPGQPLRAAALFLTAVLIHGAYDFFILSPGMPSFLSIFIALSALGSSLLALRHDQSR